MSERFVELKAAKEAVHRIMEPWPNLEEDIYDLLDEIPSADVRPVVRGRDICDAVNSHCEFKCSVCGVELSSVYGGDNDFGLDGGYFNFCPNCGAQMERSEE